MLGAQQNRTFDVSVLVGAGSKLRVPVSCVEAGRWDGSAPPRGVRRRAAGRLPGAAPHEARCRRASASRPGSRPAPTRARSGTRSQRKSTRMGVNSPTGAMHDIYEDRRDRLAEMRDAIRLHDGQLGALVAIGGEIQVLDLVSRPRRLRRAARPAGPGLRARRARAPRRRRGGGPRRRRPPAASPSWSPTASPTSAAAASASARGSPSPTNGVCGTGARPRGRADPADRVPGRWRGAGDPASGPGGTGAEAVAAAVSATAHRPAARSGECGHRDRPPTTRPVGRAWSRPTSSRSTARRSATCGSGCAPRTSRRRRRARTREVLMELGIEHERRHLTRFPDHVDLGDLPIDERAERTRELVAENERVIYQGAFRVETDARRHRGRDRRRPRLPPPRPRRLRDPRLEARPPRRRRPLPGDRAPARDLRLALRADLRRAAGRAPGPQRRRRDRRHPLRGRRGGAGDARADPPRPARRRGAARAGRLGQVLGLRLLRPLLAARGRAALGRAAALGRHRA